MNYTVCYKKLDSFFWSKIKKVKGDGFVETKNTRWFILEDETRVEISCENMIFKFSNERFMSLKKEMEKTIGSKISTESILG